MEQKFWTFSYHKGLAQLFGKVRARDERIALMVASEWCKRNSCRPPASVRPDILADESILPPEIQQEFGIAKK